MKSSPQSTSVDTPVFQEEVSRPHAAAAWLGLLIVVLTILICVFASSLGHRGTGTISTDVSYVRTVFRMYVILLGGFLAAFTLIPHARAAVRRLPQGGRDAYTYSGLLGCCVFLSLFLVECGRRQFGGFDYNILIEVGWRQILGQRPYVDFVTSTPPGFNLGIKYAYELFGVNWDANLYFSAIFACATFLWMYWLMVQISLSRLAAIFMAMAIECAAMLTLCFWWYNNSALILAAVFFLSCLLYAKDSRSRFAWFSYFFSLVLLSLMKPNIAGVTISGCFVLLLIVTDQRSRLVALTVGAAVASVLVMAANHVSIPAMLESYHSVTRERGGFSTFGFREMNRFGKVTALGWIAILSIPLLSLTGKVPSQLSRRDWKGMALSLLFSLSLVVALYGLATNGEFRDVECTVLLAGGGVLVFASGSVFGFASNYPLLGRLYIAIVCAAIAADVYVGAARTRVYTIGPHMFFEWQDHNHRIEQGFLKNMRVSSTMIDVEQQVGLAKSANPGPYFFGPRVDFNYAVFGLPSPDKLPAWWHPGTAFARSDQARLIHLWQEHNFQTLIFLKDDYTYYPAEFLDVINREYSRDDEYSSLTIYRRHALSRSPLK